MNESEHILARLAAADRQHQKEAGGTFLLSSVKYICAFIVAAFLADVIWHLQPGWRLAILLAFIAGAIALAGIAWYLAFVRRNRLEHIARFLENRSPVLGSRLINLLQLRAQTDDPALTPLTRQLAREAIDGYSLEMRSAPLEHLARTDAVRRHLFRAAWVFAVFALLLGVFFRVSTTEFARFLDPFGDHPPYSFTRLEIVSPGPNGTNVLYGKGLVVKVKSSGHQPREVYLTSHPADHPEQATTVSMFDKGSAGFDQVIEPVRSEMIVYAHTKNHASLSRQSRIGVILTPQIEKSFVRTAPPAYTALKPAEKPYAFKAIQALAGSEVRFRIQSNRPLKEGMIEISSGGVEPLRIAMTKSADNEVAGAFVAAESARLKFSVTDVAGITSQDDLEGSLTVTHDLPPAVQVADPSRDAFVAMDFKLKTRFEASDDYGIRTLRLHRGLNGVYSAPKTIHYDTAERDRQETLEFDFAGLGVEPGDVISLFAEAIDTAPEPHIARSQIVRLLVISVEEYNDFIREQSDIEDMRAKYEGLMEDLQDLIDRQRKLAESAAKMEAALAKADARQKEALTQELDALMTKQNELNHLLNQHAGRMETFVRDNPVYDMETDFQEALNEQAKNIRGSADTNNAAMRELANRTAPPEGGRSISPAMFQEFERQAREQVARLDQAQEATEREVIEKMEDMAPMQELMKDFNLFEALYQAQQEIASHAQAYNRQGQLSREDQLSLKELAATEKQVSEMLRELTGKLREDAAAAEERFPKAAQSGRELAGKIESLRLAPLAQQATDQMLAGAGDRSYQLAERLRSEMEKLFESCQGGNCPSSGELDSYLSLNKMQPGRNFAQMSQSKKFGRPGQGNRPGRGQGEGMSGSSGYAMNDNGKVEVLGNESNSSRNSATARQSARQGRGRSSQNILAGGDTEKADVMHGLNPVNRESGAVAAETVIEEYNEVVETYFKAITTRKPQQ